MKTLIRSDFVAIRQGEFVEANVESGEFIFDSENVDFAMGTLQEVAEANEIELNKKLNKADFAAGLADGLAALDLPEQNEPTETQIVEDIVRAGCESEKSDDEMMIEIVTAGVSFKKAARLFKQAMESLGLRVSAKERKTAIHELLEEQAFQAKDADEVDAMVELILAEDSGIADTNHKQAIQAIRAYCKANDMTMPKTAKKKPGAVGFFGEAYDWMVANPSATNDELVAWMKSKEKNEAAQRRFVGIFEFAKRYADSVANTES